MGESPWVPEGSAEFGASTAEEGWGSGSESGARRGSRGACLRILQTGAPAARARRGRPWGGVGVGGRRSPLQLGACVHTRLKSAVRSKGSRRARSSGEA